ncbi:MAG: hypothetical protein JJLCMIEE_01430 [Acidimicrobiales bacterium]|nr:MAG: FtsX-like permease family protein [Actinomycetota bacterium]MBV6508370.1 hypothetical protein [Acidimicrobiales bacterium]RIK04812.1 MAG: ABC transporter permease [Acidobacteriota bacterium]
MAHSKGLWLRWSWRDLRSRWLQVAAIALIIALGSGTYAGLSGYTQWRRQNYPASYQALNTHDIRVATTKGTTVPEGTLLGSLDQLEHPEWLAGAEERLIVPTQVDASAAGSTILVPGEIVGVDVTGGGPDIDQVHVMRGRAVDEGDITESRVVLDYHFAEHHGLPPTGELTLSGGRTVDYVGLGFTPDYFMVTTEQGSLLAEAGFAVMFAPLQTAQELAERPEQVNELVLTLREGVDLDAATAEVERWMDRVHPGLAAEVTPIDEERLYRLLLDDIDGDQKLFRIFALLILGGAAFAAFNLTGRIVEAQRREIGIGMSLGLSRWRIAVRPLLVGLQIALLGVVLGAGVGLVVGSLLSDLHESFLPLPVWEAPLQPGAFLSGIALGLGLVFAATVYPVWRAVRVDPVDAIATGPRSTRGSGVAPLLRRIPVPGSSIAQFPLRNVLRSPRRTALTAFGIAAAIAVLVAVIGMVDSFLSTIDKGEADILGPTPERVNVTLDFFYPTDAEQVQAISEVEGVAAAEPGLALGGSLVDGSEGDIDVFIQLIDFDNELWTPTPVEGSLETESPSVVISEKAAADLGVEPGDTVTLRHPRREGLVDYSFVESELPVSAIHPNPYRFMLYMDLDDAALMNLEGIVNTVAVEPEPGVSGDEMKRALFGRDGVAAVEPVADVAGTLEDAMEDALGFLDVVRGAVLVLALLIAFNSTSISADERAREHATMLAFGVRPRTVLLTEMGESLIIGVLATLLGIGLGRLIITWLVRVLLPSTMPDITVWIDVAPATYLTAAVMGVVAVSIAPLLTIRRLRRMDIPSALRVVE